MITKTKRKKSKIYFGLAAQQGVEDFLLAEELQEKHKIFNERLHAPFTKLIENIVFTYRFINLGEPVQSLQLECLSHVYLNLHKIFSCFGRFKYTSLVSHKNQKNCAFPLLALQYGAKIQIS